jgi:hypothetical protein
MPKCYFGWHRQIGTLEAASEAKKRSGYPHSNVERLTVIDIFVSGESIMFLMIDKR